MASESVASFLDLAKSNRLLPPDQVEDLVRGSGVPNHSLAALCEFLLDRGSLTTYQAERIRAGKGGELNFAGYPVVADYGPCPGGIAYKALHPSLRTPIVLRRLRTEWVGPADNIAALVGRAREISPITHPYLAQLLDAGVYADEAFVTLETFPGANLFTLVTDIGPMPAALAVGYARQVALGLQAAHDRGVVHGDVRPTNVQIGPLVVMSKPRPDGTPRFRPTPTATVKVMELGLVPLRPPANEWVAMAPGLAADDVVYLPPERMTTAAATAAGDVYGLGATLYFLMTGRAPYSGATAAEVVASIESGPPTPLAAHRPDLGADLLALVQSLMAADPTQRPSMAVAAEKLGMLGTPAAPPPVVVAPLPPPIADVPRLVPDDGPGGADVAPLESVAGEADVAPLEVAPPEGDVDLVEAAPVEMVPAEAGDMPEGYPASPPPANWVLVPYQGSHDPAAAYTLPEYQAPAWPAPSQTDSGWGPIEEPAGFDPTAHAADDSPTPPRAAETGSKLWLWIGVGVGLQVLAVLLWMYFIFQPGCSSTPDTPAKKATPKKSK